MTRRFLAVVLVASMLLGLAQISYGATAPGRFQHFEVKVGGETRVFMIDTGAGHYYELKWLVNDEGEREYYLVLVPRFGSHDEEFRYIKNKARKGVK
ncbi:MAG: hypothetical protein ACYTEQ_01685 [Planctomycetota bacterium]|jgi:hypothetical protein